MTTETAVTKPETNGSTATLQQLPLELVDVGANIRHDPGELAELAASIKELGVLSPVEAIGPDANGRFRLVWGQRRFMASQIAGVTTLPAIVKQMSEANAPGARRAIEQLAENLQRKSLNDMEEADALAAVLGHDKSLTQAELATRLGRSAPWVANTLGLRRAPKLIQDSIRKGTLTAAHAKAVSGLPPEEQERLAKAAIRDSSSAHELENNAKYARQRQAELDRNAKKSSAGSKAAIAALEAASFPKDAVLFLSIDWQMDSNVIAKAIRDAGWTKLNPQGWGWARPEGCRCTAIRLNLQGPAKLEPVCTRDAHRDAAYKASQAKRTEQEKGDEADRKRLAKAVRAATPFDLDPTVARLIIRAIDGYNAKGWSEYAKLNDRELRNLIAERVTSAAAVRGSYGGRQLAIGAVLKALGVEPPAPAEKPARVKKAAKA